MSAIMQTLPPADSRFSPRLFRTRLNSLFKGLRNSKAGKGAWVTLWVLLSGLLLSAQALPTISFFGRMDSSVVFGSGTSLNMIFSNGVGKVTATNSTTFTVTQEGVIPVESGSPIEVHPREDTTYTLTVTNEEGESSSASLQVMCFVPVRLLAASGDHDLVYRADGSTVAWGSNAHGELGDGTTAERGGAFVMVVGLPTDIRALAAGSGFSVALAGDGTVWTWGANNLGQLGDGTFVDRVTPAMLQGFNNVTAISVKRNHVIALKTDGTVWTWGSNEKGQLGDGSFTDRNIPVPVNLHGYRAFSVVAGGYHSLALVADGVSDHVFAWGSANNGECGIGSASSTPFWVPMRVLTPVGPLGVIGAGDGHSLLASWYNNSQTWCWGKNSYGQANPWNGLGGIEPTPSQSFSWRKIKALTGGSHHSVAIAEDGRLITWGRARECGVNNDSDQIQSPIFVEDGQIYATAIAAGSNHTLVLLNSGEVKAFGSVNAWVGMVPVLVEGLNSNIP